MISIFNIRFPKIGQYNLYIILLPSCSINTIGNAVLFWTMFSQRVLKFVLAMTASSDLKLFGLGLYGARPGVKVKEFSAKFCFSSTKTLHVQLKSLKFFLDGTVSHNGLLLYNHKKTKNYTESSP